MIMNLSDSNRRFASLPWVSPDGSAHGYYKRLLRNLIHTHFGRARWRVPTIPPWHGRKNDAGRPKIGRPADIIYGLFGLFHNHFGDGVALTADIETADSGVLYAYALQIEIFYRSIAVINTDFVNACGLITHMNIEGIDR